MSGRRNIIPPPSPLAAPEEDGIYNHQTATGRHSARNTNSSRHRSVVKASTYPLQSQAYHATRSQHERIRPPPSPPSEHSSDSSPHRIFKFDEELPGFKGVPFKKSARRRSGSHNRPSSSSRRHRSRQHSSPSDSWGSGDSPPGRYSRAGASRSYTRGEASSSASGHRSRDSRSHRHITEGFSQLRDPYAPRSSSPIPITPYDPERYRKAKGPIFWDGEPDVVHPSRVSQRRRKKRTISSSSSD